MLIAQTSAFADSPGGSNRQSFTRNCAAIARWSLFKGRQKSTARARRGGLSIERSPATRMREDSSRLGHTPAGSLPIEGTPRKIMEP